MEILKRCQPTLYYSNTTLFSNSPPGGIIQRNLPIDGYIGFKRKISLLNSYKNCLNIRMIKYWATAGRQ